MRKWTSVSILITIALALPTLGAWAGYRFAKLRMGAKPWRLPAEVAKRVNDWRQVETLKGCFQLHKLSLDGVEECYYDPAIDLSQVTWIGPDVPTPFVSYAPAPGPLAGGHINSMQFRYDRELEDPKPESVYRIFLIGGSTAYGAGASSNQTTVGGYLEKHLNENLRSGGLRIEVITAAANAWTTTHERILIENRLVELEPDLVISLSGFNDSYWGCLDRNVLWFRAYQDDYFHLLTNSVLACNFDRDFPDLRPGLGESISARKMGERLHRNVMLAHASLRTVDADYCFVLQPALFCTRKELTLREEGLSNRNVPNGMNARYDACRRELGGIDAAGFQFVDATDVFDGLNAQTGVFIDSCHFGDRGYDLIAKRIMHEITPIMGKRIDGSRYSLRTRRNADQTDSR